MSKKSERRKKQLSLKPSVTVVSILFGFFAIAVIAGAIHFLKRQPPVSSPPSSSMTEPARPDTSNTVPQNPALPLPKDWRAEISSLPAEKQGDVFWNKGDELLAHGDFEQAAEAYRLSIQQDSSSEGLHYNLGIALARSGKIDEAIAAYKEALNIAPDYAEAHNNLGNLLMRKKLLAEAIEHFTRAAGINPEIATSHNNLGIALAQSGRHVEAGAAFARAVSLDPNYLEGRFNLAQSYLARGDTNAAVLELKKSLETKPDFTAARRLLDDLSRVGKSPP